MGKKRNRGRTNINSLPVELIDLIVTQVDELVRDDRDPRHAFVEAANLAGDAGIEAGLMALFGGFLGGGFQPPRAPVRAPTPPPVPSRPEEEDGELPLHDEVDSEQSSESEDEQEEDDEDGYDSDGELIISDGTYPDGLPSDPVLPLSLISRPFLTVARQRLYRKFDINSVYQAFLLLRSLEAPHAAAVVGAEPNHLASLVRYIRFTQTQDMSPERGGANVIIDILKLCTDLEDLSIGAAFLHSSARPLFKALENLKSLKSIHLKSGKHPDYPLTITTPLILNLLEESWFNLEELSIVGLKDASHGSPSQEDEMWEREYDEEGNDDDEEGEDDDEEEESSEEEIEDNYESDSDESDNGTRKDEKRRIAKELAREKRLEEKLLEKLSAKKPRGLKTIKLLEVAVDHSELALIFKHSKDTLQHLLMSPTSDLTRRGLGHLILTFGVNLTQLKLDCDSNWHPKSKPSPIPKTPTKQKAHIDGSPTPTTLDGIERHPYFLDCVVTYLPHLALLKWSGPLASSNIFMFLGSKVRTIEFGYSPDVKPMLIAKILRRSTSRTVQARDVDGAVTTRLVPVKVAPALKCITINHDDLNYSTQAVNTLTEAVDERGICLHLSGGAGPMGDINFNVGPNGIGMGIALGPGGLPMMMGGAQIGVQVVAGGGQRAAPAPAVVPAPAVIPAQPTVVPTVVPPPPPAAAAVVPPPVAQPPPVVAAPQPTVVPPQGPFTFVPPPAAPAPAPAPAPPAPAPPAPAPPAPQQAAVPPAMFEAITRGLANFFGAPVVEREQGSETDDDLD